LPVEISGSVVDYEGKPSDMVFIRDASSRKKLEKEREMRITEIEKINKLAVEGKG
jgi:hypothetical protein